MADSEKKRVIMAEVIAKAGTDASYRDKVVKDAAGTLRDAGYPVESGTDYKVVVSDKDVRYVVLPEPTNVEGVRAAIERMSASLEHLPAGFEWRVVQNTTGVRYLPLRTEKVGEISDEDLEKIAGGGTVGAYSNVAVATEVAGVIYAATAAVAT